MSYALFGCSFGFTASDIVCGTCGDYRCLHSPNQDHSKAAREALRPYVYLDIFFLSPAEMIILVGNSGNKVANNIRVKLVDASSKKLAELIGTLPLESGMGHLAPGSTRKYRLIVSTHDIFPNDEPPPTLRFELLYHDGLRPVSDAQEIDLAGFDQSLFPWTGDSTHEIVGELKQIVRKMPEPRRSLNSYKLCPYCGTRLIESAKKCHGCLEWLSGPAARPQNLRSSARPFRTASKRVRRGR